MLVISLLDVGECYLSYFTKIRITDVEFNRYVVIFCFIEMKFQSLADVKEYAIHALYMTGLLI